MTIDSQVISVALPTESATCEGGSITLDESWAPFVQGRVTIKTPTNLAALDNRTGAPRVTITADQTFGDADLTSALTALWSGKVTSQLTAAWAGQLTSALTARHSRPYNPTETHAQVTRAFNLLIRSYSRQSDGSVSLDLSSDEAMLQEWIAVSTFSPDSVTIRDLVNEILLVVFGNLSGIALEPTGANVAVDPALYPLERGESAWAFLSSLAQGAGMRLWCTEARVWRLEYDPAPVAGTVMLDRLISWDERITREGDWYNAVGYTSPVTGGTVTNYVYATISQPRKMLLVETLLPPVGTAIAAATALLGRAVAKGKLIAARAVNDWAATPGMTAKVTVDPGTELTRRLSSVTFDLGSFEMTATTKEQ